jgi:predicted nucleic acid-binding protein
VIAYIDSSVIIRLLFGQPNSLSEWSEVTQPISSDLVRVECLRTIDRTAIKAEMAGDDVATLRSDALDLLTRLRLAPLTSAVLTRAAEPFPTALGTLDALHLASAIEAARELDGLVVATHDTELALAARSVGFEIIGA